jgi:subtilisin-like proprotein convertase family protein
MRFLVILLTLSVVNAGTILTPTFMVSTTIPDHDIIGIADTRSVTTSFTEITSIEVAISLSGGWNGDLYAYLSHAGGFCVLLNRPGRTLAVPDGSGSSAISVVFSDLATADIHTALPGSGVVSGRYQPDGRNDDPLTVLDTTLRSAFLDSFIGVNPNGEWTLFIADVSSGSSTVFNSWSLAITAVPEPASTMLVACGLLICLRRRR